jgi:predicted DNA-binding transcriptional regulator AlpA
MSQKLKQTKGIRLASQMKRKITLNRAQRALEELQKEKKVISFKAVAKKGGISTTWLYKNMKNEIMALRKPRHSSVFDEPDIMEHKKDTVLLLRNQIKELEKENTQLKEILREFFFAPVSKN